MKIVISGYPLLTPIVREASRGTPRNSSGRIVVCSSSSEEVMRTTEGSITALALYTRICPCHAYIYIYTFIHSLYIYIYILCMRAYQTCIIQKYMYNYNIYIYHIYISYIYIIYIYHIYIYIIYIYISYIYKYIYTCYRSIIAKPPKPTSSLEYYTTWAIFRVSIASNFAQHRQLSQGRPTACSTSFILDKSAIKSWRR